MAETTETITVAGANITLSLLVWRKFQRPMVGVVERALEINPHLAAAGVVIPVGTTLLLPIPGMADASDAPLAPIRLW